MNLNQALNQIEKEKLVSFHMPGHKNGRLLESHPLSYAADITEIPLADHLYEPTGCIANTQEALSLWYKSHMSYMVINGSTAGILAMILGTVRRGERILINRNAHLSVYNALVLGGIEPVYLYPDVDECLGMPIGFHYEALEGLLKKEKDIKACVLTYPTYEGICYDLKPLINLCHAYGVLVLMDEAHGAHLHLNHGGPHSALDLGADVVVHSFHKTLPAMTQTACLHIGPKHRLTEGQLSGIAYHLRAIQTSSPSYVLMSSIDTMLGIIEQKGKALTESLKRQVLWTYQSLTHLKAMRLVPLKNQEFSKMILAISPEYYEVGKWDGHALSQILRERFGIQVEFATPLYCLLMTSVANQESDFQALVKALLALDLEQTPRETLEPQVPFKAFDPIRAFQIYDAIFMPFEWVSVGACEGRIAAEFVTPYPPGIPLVVPGERIDQDMADWLKTHYEKIKVLR